MCSFVHRMGFRAVETGHSGPGCMRCPAARLPSVLAAQPPVGSGTEFLLLAVFLPTLPAGIAAKLVEILTETNQEVPAWLQNMAQVRAGAHRQRQLCLSTRRLPALASARAVFRFGAVTRTTANFPAAFTRFSSAS